jgi:dihydroflavonol-4-reductase
LEQAITTVDTKSVTKVLVTGADGFLGCNLVRELLKRGHRVRAFIQPERNNATLDGLDIEYFRGDILNEHVVLEASKNCDAIIHAAAITNTSPAKSMHLRRVNIQGTKHAIEAAKKNGVTRFIHVGTANSFGFGTKDDPGDETRPYSASKYGLDYFNAKHDAHRLVLREVKEYNLQAIIVNPTFMVGPYDAKPGFGTIILALYHERMPGCPVGGRNYIHVRDVAVGIANALQKGRIGECYILGHQNLSYNEIFTKISTVIGVPSPNFIYPPFLTKAYGMLGSFVGIITGKPPQVNFALARISCDEHYYTSKKAVQELGLPQTPIEIAIEEAFAWFKENGYLEKKL